MFLNAFGHDHPSCGCGRLWGSLGEWLRFPLVPSSPQEMELGVHRSRVCSSDALDVGLQSLLTLLPEPCPALPWGWVPSAKGFRCSRQLDLVLGFLEFAFTWCFSLRSCRQLK